MYQTATDLRYRPARPSPRGIPVTNTGDTMTRTGLVQDTACGHTIRLSRNNESMVATVVVSARYEGAVAGDGLARSAAAFAARASRFLGAGWTVIPWEGRLQGVED